MLTPHTRIRAHAYIRIHTFAWGQVDDMFALSFVFKGNFGVHLHESGAEPGQAGIERDAHGGCGLPAPMCVHACMHTALREMRTVGADCLRLCMCMHACIRH